MGDTRSHPTAYSSVAAHLGEMVELFDIMPTLLELAGTRATHTHFARSLCTNGNIHVHAIAEHADSLSVCSFSIPRQVSLVHRLHSFNVGKGNPFSIGRDSRQ